MHCVVVSVLQLPCQSSLGQARFFFVVKNAKLSHVADLGLGFHFRLKKCEGSQLSALRLALQSKSASLGHVMSACCEAGL